MKPGSDERGFTLAELLLVIVLLGIMASVAMTTFGRASGTLKLDEAAQEIQTAFRYARHQSIKTDVPTSQKFGLWFTLPQGGADNGNWFKTVKGNGTPTPDVIIHPLDKKDYAVDFDNSGYFSGITLSGVSLDVNDQLYFDRRGTPSVGGTVTIQYAGDQRTITVNRPSGVVSIN